MRSDDMRRLLPILSAAFLLASGIADAAKYPMTIKDCRGKAITISREPKRIVSLAPSNTEILFALGLDSRIVGVTKYCNYPAAAKKKPKIGDRAISVETLISLKPDLVLAHGMLNEQAIHSVEDHGFTVVAFDPKTIDEVTRDILLIGRITNREKQAVQITKRISSAKALVKQKACDLKTKPKVLVAVQADPLWAAGPKTFIDEMIRLAGGVNAAADAKPGFNAFSAEAAVWRNPDVIIGTTNGDKQVFTRGLWKDTNAARSGRIYEADPDLLVRPGPRLADGILLIARMANPDAFKNRR